MMGYPKCTAKLHKLLHGLLRQTFASLCDTAPEDPYMHHTMLHLWGCVEIKLACVAYPSLVQHHFNNTSKPFHLSLTYIHFSSIQYMYLPPRPSHTFAPLSTHAIPLVSCLCAHFLPTATLLESLKKSIFDKMVVKDKMKQMQMQGQDLLQYVGIFTFKCLESTLSNLQCKKHCSHTFLATF